MAKEVGGQRCGRHCQLTKRWPLRLVTKKMEVFPTLTGNQWQTLLDLDKCGGDWSLQPSLQWTLVVSAASHKIFIASASGRKHTRTTIRCIHPAGDAMSCRSIAFLDKLDHSMKLNVF